MYLVRPPDSPGRSGLQRLPKEVERASKRVSELEPEREREQTPLKTIFVFWESLTVMFVLGRDFQPAGNHALMIIEGFSGA
jgi:hypothetical protein